MDFLKELKLIRQMNQNNLVPSASFRERRKRGPETLQTRDQNLPK